MFSIHFAAINLHQYTCINRLALNRVEHDNFVLEPIYCAHARVFFGNSFVIHLWRIAPLVLI